MSSKRWRGGGFLVLTVAAVVFFGGSVIGFNLLTSKASTTEETATCESRTIKAGDDLTPNLVTVDVYNASRTAGLANRVSVLMQRRGFLTGQVANNPTDITTNDIVILTTDPKDPMVALVRAQFDGKVKLVNKAVPGAEGIGVLIGRNYADRKLRAKGEKAKTKAKEDTTVCIPVLPVT